MNPEVLLKFFEFFLAAIVGVGGYLVSQKVSKSTIKKQDSEGANEITAAAITLVKPLREEIEELRTQLQKFEDGVYILIDQLKELGIEPRWKPPKRDTKDNSIEKGKSKNIAVDV